MDGQMKLILGLLIAILVLGGIFGLKFFGIIKPSQKSNNSEISKSKLDEIAKNIQSENESTSITNTITKNYDNSIGIQYDRGDPQNITGNTSDYLLSTNSINNTEDTNTINYDFNNIETYQRDTSGEYKSFLRNNPASKTTLIFLIVLLVLYFFVNIGVAKLYRKLSMPDWTYYYTIFSPILMIIALIIFRRTPMPAVITIGCISSVVNALFFSSIDINPIWAFVPTLITGLEYLGSFGNILSIGFSIAFLVIWVRAISNLAETFGKGEGFKIGLFFLPFIFFPILGFQRD